MALDRPASASSVGRRRSHPGQPIETLRALFGSAVLVVLPVTIVLGIAFPTASALLRDQASEAGTESGSLLASNTTGAILGSLLVPFVLMPTVGSPWVIVILAVVNASLGIGLALIGRPRRLETLVAGAGRARGRRRVPAATRRSSSSRTRRSSCEAGGQIFDSTEDEIASVQAGQIRSTPELWVAGTSMTLLTVDAKLMPILPLIARPDSKRALVVAFGMGTAFRSALIAGLRTDAVELVPSVPDMFGFYYPDAPAVLADPDGRVIIADGRNHLELTTERFDIILTDPPPPIESSGASVISSLEYYEAGRDHLHRRRRDDAMGAVRGAGGRVPGPHPDVRLGVPARRRHQGRRRLRRLHARLGVAAQLRTATRSATILARPGVLEDISSAYDSPATTVDGWIEVIARQQWLAGTGGRRLYAGVGPLITDDRPRPEYFLLRRLSAGEAR